MNELEQLEREYARLLLKFGLSIDDVSQNLDGADVIERGVHNLGGVNSSPDVSSKVTAGNREDTIEFLRRVRAHPYLAGVNHGILRVLRNELETGIDHQGLKLPFPVFVGEFPTHEINGCILQSPPGALILINSGLVFLLHHLSRVVALMSVANQPAGQAVDASSDRITKQVAAHLFANALLTYFFLGLSERPKIPVLPGPFQFLVSGLVSQESTKFVLAHEFAHAIKGHLDTANGSYDQELEADETALAILMNQSIDPSVSEDEERLVKEARYCAPLFFFALDDLISDVLKDHVIQMLYEVTIAVGSNENSLRDTYSVRAHGSGYAHPPGTIRRAALLKQLRATVDEQALSLSNIFVSAIGFLRTDVITILREWCVERIEDLYKEAKNVPPPTVG